MTSIGIVGAGAMGSAIGRVLVGSGCTVLTPLDGRSPSTRVRAIKAGMQACPYEDLGSVSLILSIVPPAQAADVVTELLPVLSRPGAPQFVDANALAPDTKAALADTVASAGGRMLDGVIIGAPPVPSQHGPRLYVSGDGAATALKLRPFGLDVRVLDGPVGTAAALKMCYAALNKGVTALTTATLLAAERSGAADALLEEFGISQTYLLERSRSAVPAMYPKAYRWVAEFDEIACFMQGDQHSAEIFRAIARFYADRADAQTTRDEPGRVRTLLTRQH